MRIGIDARFYGAIGKGLGRYTSELISHLEELDTEHDYLVFLRRANFDEYVPKNPRFRKVLAEFPWYTAREQVLYPLWLKKFGLDLMHFPHFNAPFLYRRPFVVTVHDLILLEHPTTRASTLGPLRFKVKFWFYLLAIRRALKAAKAVVTVSHCTKREIETRFPFTKQKQIVVTYEACASPFRAPAAAPAGAPAADVGPGPYMLYVGNAYPHKNLDRLLEAFAAFRAKGRDDWRLVLVGARDYFYERLESEAKAAGRNVQVLFFGHATDDELASLYERAAFYVFPSLCEGFGLPPLEAMCKGVAVTSSKASCLPEILGDAALYFEPEDVGDIVRAIDALASDPSLRRALADKGRAWSSRFDWRSCAAATLDVYRRALGSQPQRHA